MKKKALAAFLSLALLLALPLPASASGGQYQIYCTFSGLRTEAPPVTSAPAPAQPTYAVNIPATYNTNTTPLPCHHRQQSGHRSGEAPDGFGRLGEDLR